MIETYEILNKYFEKALEYILEGPNNIERKVLAHNAGFSVQYLGRFIGSKAPKFIPIETQKKIAKAAGYSLDSFLELGKKHYDFNEQKNKKINESDSTYKIPNRCHPDEKNLLEMTRKILSSDTEYAESLAANIRSFHHAVENKAHINGLLSRVAKLEEHIELDRRKEECRRNNEPYNGIERRFEPDRRKRNL